jgi:integrase/recombinase XerD
LPDFLVNQFKANLQCYFFQGLNGSPLSVRTIDEIIQERVKKSGINKQITPHSFRRSFATNLYNKCKKLTSVQKLLGHSNISTTANYIHNSFENLRVDYNKLFEKEEIFGNFNDSIIYNKYHLSI